MGAEIIPWGCWTDHAKPHPWLPIADIACGFDERLTDPRCRGCHRSRAEAPWHQFNGWDEQSRPINQLARGQQPRGQ